MAMDAAIHGLSGSVSDPGGFTGAIAPRSAED